jgi:glycosyltransferase involved in cell wall biosynthesis
MDNSQQTSRGRVLALLIQTTVPTTLNAFFRGQLEWLQHHGLEVHVVSSPGASLENVAKRERIVTHAVPMSRRVTLVADLFSLCRLVLLYGSLCPSIVHGFTAKGGLLAMMAAWLTRRPVRVYTIFGVTPTTRKGLKKYLLRTTERLACALAHRVFCECESIRRWAIEENMTESSKIYVLAAWSCNTVEDILIRGRRRAEYRRSAREALGIADSALVMGFVGRVVPDKGVRELIETQRILGREFSNLYLLLVGSPEAEQPLSRTTVELLRSTPRTLSVGFQADVAPYLAAMDVLVHPSYREGLPTVPLEAAAMGVPVVTTAIPGCVDVIEDGQTGILVPPRDSAAVAEALRVLLRDSAMRERMGTKGREWAARWCDVEQTWEELRRHYEQLFVTSGARHLPARRLF